MKHKKNIDHLYREKFDNVETTPPEAAWKNISSRLPQKEPRRKVLPLWYKLAGAAAVVAILFTLGTSLWTNSSVPEDPEVTISREGTGIDWETNSISSEIMLESSILLEDVLEYSQELTYRASLVSEKTTTRSTENIFAGIITEPEELPLSGSSSTLSDNTGLASENPEQFQDASVATLEESMMFPQQEAEEELSSETVVATEPPVKRLRISTKIAPVYYNHIGSGSSLDRQFSASQGAGDVSLSYGVNLTYQISQKFKVRSGVNKVDLSYHTENVPLMAAANIAALGGESVNNKMTTTIASPVTGSMNQRLGFIEIPLEVEYSLISRKIGLNLIGGGSTLFVNDNMISLESAGHSTDLGEAKNLNNVSFSTNIGFGIDYNISSQFQLNFEPMLKFQMNTFENTTDVNPYYFGIFSGFSYKF